MKLFGVSSGIWHGTGNDQADRVEKALTEYGECSAVEISALHTNEVPGAIELLKQWRRPPGVSYVSLHAPAKGLYAGREEELLGARDYIDALIIHPDIVKPHEWNLLEAFGDKLVVENMDIRKNRYSSIEEMKTLLYHLPKAGLCLDLAHALTIDNSGALAMQFINGFWGRVVQVHISGIEPTGNHCGMSREDVIIHSSALQLLDGSAPIILESDIKADALRLLK